MTNTFVICAPGIGQVVALLVANEQHVAKGEPLAIIEAMKMQTTVTAECAGVIRHIAVQVGEQVKEHSPLLELHPLLSNASQPNSEDGLSHTDCPLQQQLYERLANTGDKRRGQQRQKRQQKGFRSARENLADLCENSHFLEYGQLAVAAQRQRKDYQSLQTDTAADGVITGLTKINTQRIDAQDYETALIINDYSVLAGTQGYFHHMKLDRIISIIAQKKLPTIMLTEGGGGRPGDTDITTVVSGLQCTTFSRWAGLKGVVPRIAIANGYNFAGNAALFGAADIRIATQKANIGLAGPAMIEGGGLGQYLPGEIGPSQEQQYNGVVDILAEDERQAIALAKTCLGYFQGASKAFTTPDVSKLSCILPTDRRFVYDILLLIRYLVDEDSFTELKPLFGRSVIVGFARIEGRPIGLIANQCKYLGGAIDVDGASKLDEFMQLCNHFAIPLLSLCDTPGFMVGPEHEKLAAVTQLSKLFCTSAQLRVPCIAVVIRKCYGLGAQVMLFGSSQRPLCTLAWPNGEFGPMGLEGAVKLGFGKELQAESNPAARQALFNSLLNKAYQQGQAIEVATLLEIDQVISPESTREALVHLLS